jgi:energy-coupling factor transporter ATP-binding protein EcfA2
MSTAIQFKKAVKFEAKGRVALIGPAGSGKSYTSLVLAKLLAGDKRIAAVDTEHGSLSKYADLFDFDVIEPDGYSTDSWIDSLTAAEDAGYGVFLTDSLSHYWMGRDGALEFVDNASKRFKDQMGGWKEFSPIERAMIDRMIASPCHIICTMRTKTEYVEEVNAQGKKVRKKVGLAPVQRQGLEFEFDLVAYMDDENTLITDKTRCSYYTKKTISSPKEKDFKPFSEWLQGEHRDEPIRVPVDSKTIDIGDHKQGTKEAQAFVLERKLAAVAPAPVAIGEDFLDRLAAATRQQLMMAVTALITEHIPKAFSPDAGSKVIEDAKARFGGKSFRDLTDDQARELAKALYAAVSVKQTLAAAPSDEMPPDALLVLWEEMTDTYPHERNGRTIRRVLQWTPGVKAKRFGYCSRSD